MIIERVQAMDGASIDSLEEAILLFLSASLVIAALSGAVWLHFGR
jgi:hypothetical protein